MQIVDCRLQIEESMGHREMQLAALRQAQDRRTDCSMQRRGETEVAGNYKSRNPNNKQITITEIVRASLGLPTLREGPQFQNSKYVWGIEYWNLRIICNLVLGIWDFGLRILKKQAEETKKTAGFLFRLRRIRGPLRTKGGACYVVGETGSPFFEKRGFQSGQEGGRLSNPPFAWLQVETDRCSVSDWQMVFGEPGN